LSHHNQTIMAAGNKASPRLNNSTIPNPKKSLTTGKRKTFPVFCAKKLISRLVGLVSNERSRERWLSSRVEWSHQLSSRRARAMSDHESQIETLLCSGLGRELVGMQSMTPQEGEEDGTQ
jgi:hypothetical protein